MSLPGGAGAAFGPAASTRRTLGWESPLIVCDMMRVTSEYLTGFLVGLGLVGVLLTSWLVISELFREPTCPPLLGIPACYLVLAEYVAATVGAWLAGSRVGDVAFMVGAVAVTVIGVNFSVGQLRGTAECPTFEGLPMCYVSLFTGVTLLVVDQIRRRARR